MSTGVLGHLACATRIRPIRIRSFATSTSCLQAVPSEKPALIKTFKIYRWVIRCTIVVHPVTSVLTLLVTVQNPDDPATKPRLQTYSIDLNQCGPMVSFCFAVC